MAGFVVAADQNAQHIPEGVPLGELITIAKFNSRPLTEVERRAYVVQKNKILNISLLKKQWEETPDYDRPAIKLNKAKLMKFVTTEPKRFHPYLVEKFYQIAVIASDELSFTTEVHGTQFDIFAWFMAEEFGINNDGASISTYQDGIINIEKEH